MKEHRCIVCNKVYTSSQSLWNHKKKCKQRQLPLQIRNPSPNSLQESGPLQTFKSEEERLNNLEVRSDDIDDIIDKGVVKMKEKIWNYLAECHDVDEKERKGGSVTMNEQKESNEKEDEDSNEKEDEEEEKNVDEVAEEIFHEVISKDKKKLEKMIDNLSQEYDFSELAMEIKELLNTYFTTKTDTSSRYYMKYDHKNELMHHRLITDITKKLQNLQGRGRKLLALEMEILVRRIEKTRTAVHELFQGMDIENNDDKHRYLRKLERRGLIDNVEINELSRQLNPENVRHVLKTKDR